MQDAYAAIGRAVMAAQSFETAMVPIFEVFKVHTDLDYSVKTGGNIPDGAFKVPLRNILKELTERGGVAPELGAVIDAFIEDRHTLIHRCIQTYGCPRDGDAEGFAPIIELAHRVEKTAKQLIQTIVGYFLEYGEPEWAAANPDESKARLADIFRNTGLKE